MSETRLTRAQIADFGNEDLVGLLQGAFDQGTATQTEVLQGFIDDPDNATADTRTAVVDAIWNALPEDSKVSEDGAPAQKKAKSKAAKAEKPAKAAKTEKATKVDLLDGEGNVIPVKEKNKGGRPKKEPVPKEPKPPRVKKEPKPKTTSTRKVNAELLASIGLVKSDINPYDVDTVYGIAFALAERTEGVTFVELQAKVDEACGQETSSKSWGLADLTAKSLAALDGKTDKRAERLSKRAETMGVFRVEATDVERDGSSVYRIRNIETGELVG